ncbi:hypothetical protein [Enterococcus durans]|nr:hypothetical protein [Enterococcus durans]
MNHFKGKQFQQDVIIVADLLHNYMDFIRYQARYISFFYFRVD